MIDRTHALPVVRQAELAGLSRASVYYLQREDFKVGRRHVATLMVRMGIEALYRKPNTSRKHPRNKVYPYLLRGLKITRANHVWATDITYIPMAHGWVYLCAIVDWASRRVLAHRISITMETGFCLEALNEAIAKHGTPEIFNTDQGRPVHESEVHQRAARARHPDQHGRARKLARQRVRRAAVALDQVRRGVPACLRIGQPGQGQHRPIHRVLQHATAALDAGQNDA